MRLEVCGLCLGEVRCLLRRHEASPGLEPSRPCSSFPWLGAVSTLPPLFTAPPRSTDIIKPRCLISAHENEESNNFNVMKNLERVARPVWARQGEARNAFARLVGFRQRDVYWKVTS